MNPKLEKLRAEQERVQRELEQAQHQQQRLKNRLSYMNAGERKARTHRLITRGAAIESILPAVQPMTERAFYELMRRVNTKTAKRSGTPSRKWRKIQRRSSLIPTTSPCRTS